MRFSNPLSQFPWLVPDRLLGRFVDAIGIARVKKPRLGLVLSCGGARGLAHIGVIQVLEEEGIPISVIAGSSMGAYVGALWASGINGDGLVKLAAEMKSRRTVLGLIDFACPPSAGFMRGEKVRQHLARTLGDLEVEALDRRMLIVATNLDTVTGEVLQHLPVAAAVHASCAIPGICEPVELNGKRYMDGGAAEPLPVRLLKKHAIVDHVIAVNVMPTTADIRACRIASFPTPPPQPKTAWGKFKQELSQQFNLFAHGNVLDTYKRCLTAAQMRLLDDESNAADILIHPFFCESKWYDFENFDLYIKAGRNAAEAALPSIRALMNPTEKTPQRHESLPHISPVGCGAT